MLIECDHNGVGFHNCLQRTEEAGVVCNSECCKEIMFKKNVIPCIRHHRPSM